jgi:hypothetical protein
MPRNSGADPARSSGLELLAVHCFFTHVTETSLYGFLVASSRACCTISSIKVEKLSSREVTDVNSLARPGCLLSQLEVVKSYMQFGIFLLELVQWTKIHKKSKAICFFKKEKSSYS